MRPDARDMTADGPSLVLAAVDGTDTSMRAAACPAGLARERIAGCRAEPPNPLPSEQVRHAG